MATDDSTPKAKRLGTMDVTAKEGVQYLRDDGHERLIELQGLSNVGKDNVSGDKSDTAAKPHRTGTMEATLADAAALDKPQTESRTRGDKHKAHEKDGAEEKDGHSAKKAKLAKHETMHATAKEGKAVLAGEKLGGTRKETQQIKKADESTVSTPKRTQTMNATLQESSAVVDDGEQRGSSRSETSAQKQAVEASTPSAKRTHTMQDTVEAAQHIVDPSKLGGTRTETSKLQEVAKEKSKKK